MDQVQVEKIVLPKEINAKMNMWRKGYISIPEEYITFHKHAAQVSLQKQNYKTIHSSYMERDGWGDGMYFLHAVVEDWKGNLLKIKWADNQLWYRDTGHGWALI